MDGRPLVVDNVSHPVNSRLALARAACSLFDVFGIQWRDDRGWRNAHYPLFSWSG